VTRYVEYVVDATRNPVVTVCIAACAVACKVTTFEGRKICVDKALVVAVDGAHLPRPTILNYEIAFDRAVENITIAIDNRRLNPE